MRGMDFLHDTPTRAQNLVRIWGLCCACARAARLLWLTGAQESGLLWERQRTPLFQGNTGGFSKWQVEVGSIRTSINWLRTRPELSARLARFLFNDPNAPANWHDCMTLDAILWAMRLDDNDRLGLAFARLHYLRVADPIPDGLNEQAAYYKKHYNTIHGAATVQGAVNACNRATAELDLALKKGTPQ